MGNQGEVSNNPANDRALPDDEWLRESVGYRAWEFPASARPDIYEQHRVTAKCPECQEWAAELTKKRAGIAVLHADDERLEFLLTEHPTHRHEIEAARAKIAQALIETRVRERAVHKRLIKCEATLCTDEFGEAAAALAEVFDDEPSTASSEAAEEPTSAESQELQDVVRDWVAEVAVTPIGGSDKSGDPRSQICEPCREDYDALRDLAGRLEVLEELPAEQRQPDHSRSVAEAREKVKQAELRLRLCEKYLCDPATLTQQRDDQLFRPDPFLHETAELRPPSDCEHCQHICDAIAWERAHLAELTRKAAELQAEVDRVADPDDLPNWKAARDRHLGWAEESELTISILLDLLERCEREMCPDIVRDAAPSSPEVDEPASPASAGEEVSHPDAPPDPMPARETVAAWIGGEKIPQESWQAARKLGWRGPVGGWPPGVDQPQAPQHLLDRFAIEEALRAWGWKVEGITKIVSQMSDLGDPETGHGRRTTISFPLDQDGKPVDKSEFFWQRADQELAAVAFITLTHVVHNGQSGYGGQITVLATRNNRLVDARAHRRLGDDFHYFRSPYRAIYRPLVAISDDDRELRRRRRLARQPSQDAEPPSRTEDPPAQTRRIPLIIGGVVVATIAVGAALFAALGGGGGADPSAGSTAAPTTEQVDDVVSQPTTEPTAGVTDTDSPVDDPLDVADNAANGPAPAIIRRLGGPDEDPVFFAAQRDPEGGISWSIVDEEGQPLPASEIDEYWSAVISYASDSVDRLFNLSSFPCGAVTDDYRVTCPLAAGILADGEYIVVGMRLAGPIATDAAEFTYGLAFDDDGDDADNYQYAEPFDADFFQNTELWYRLQIDADGTRTMWADGVRDGVARYPRYSSALALEFDDTLVWIIPRSEVPGDHPAYRVTAFHNDGDLDNPDPATSGGDVSGLGVVEPLTPISIETVPFDNLAAIPADIAAPILRVAVGGDPDRQLTEALFAELEERINAALAAGDTDAVVRTVHPVLLGGPNGDQCKEEMETTIALATSIEFTTVPGTPDVTSGFPLYAGVASINYPTGTVEWGPTLLPGPRGRLFIVLPSCS